MDKIYTLNNLVFEWDEVKYTLNFSRHGVTFEEAAEVFFDSENIYGDASRTDEFREYVTGFSFSGNLLFTVFLERGERVRIISARKATRPEAIQYGDRE
ncbi:MAG: BrnT family toxin [Acidobacteria bacterium]|nr:BrnT family toxin [Acidobacteriota bacterium]